MASRDLPIILLGWSRRIEASTIRILVSDILIAEVSGRRRFFKILIHEQQDSGSIARDAIEVVSMREGIV